MTRKAAWAGIVNIARDKAIPNPCSYKYLKFSIKANPSDTKTA